MLIIPGIKLKTINSGLILDKTVAIIPAIEIKTAAISIFDDVLIVIDELYASL